VQAALEAHDGHAVEVAQEQSTGVSRRRCGRPAWQLRKGDGDGVSQRISEAAEAGPKDDPDPRHEAGPGTDGRLEQVETG
jgi:hypothetical protein